MTYELRQVELAHMESGRYILNIGSAYCGTEPASRWKAIVVVLIQDEDGFTMRRFWHYEGSSLCWPLTAGDFNEDATFHKVAE